MSQERSRLLKMYLLPEEMRAIRIAAAEADVPLSVFARGAVLQLVSSGYTSTEAQKGVRESDSKRPTAEN
jgi:hypothetical protein